MMQSLAFEFKEKHGSYICRELLNIDKPGAQSPTPEARTPEYYKKRPCPELIGDAVGILEKSISNK